jgi:hypothetical protein
MQCEFNEQVDIINNTKSDKRQEKHIGRCNKIVLQCGTKRRKQPKRQQSNPEETETSKSDRTDI